MTPRQSPIRWTALAIFTVVLILGAVDLGEVNAWLVALGLPAALGYGLYVSD